MPRGVSCMEDRKRIMVSPTGARRSKADHPALPITIDEIAAEARACLRAGADFLHLHVRDPNGRHSIDPGLYGEAIREVKAQAPGMDIQVTTESAEIFSVQDQYDTLKALCPEAASLSVREVARDMDLAPGIYALAADRGIALQHILYDLEDLAQMRRFQEAGIIQDDPPEVFLAFGAYAPPRNADPSSVAMAVEALGGAYPNWAACAFGPTEEATLVEVVRNGGRPRIGFENNIHLPDGSLAISTADNLARFVSTLHREGIH